MMAEFNSTNWYVRLRTALRRQVKVVFDFKGNGQGLLPTAVACTMGTAESTNGGTHRQHRFTSLLNGQLKTVAGECDCEDFFKTATWAEIAQPRHPVTGARMCYHMIAAELAVQSQRGQEG